MIEQIYVSGPNDIYSIVAKLNEVIEALNGLGHLRDEVVTLSAIPEGSVIGADGAIRRGLPVLASVGILANQLTAARPQWQIVEGVLEQLATEKNPGASG